MRRAALVVSFVVSLSSCATPPIQETKAFVSAVNTAKSAADTLVDEVNAAEKTRYARLHAKDPVFDIKNAYYIATISETPGAQKYRSGLIVLQDYANILQSLVDGSGIDAVHTQAQTLAANISAIAGAPQVAAVAQSLLPVLDRLIAAANVAEARQIAVGGAKDVHNLLTALRNGAPAIYEYLTLDLVRAHQPEKLQEYRVAVANYVVLIDELDATFSQLVIAFDRPSNPVTLAALVDASAQLKADVSAARQSLAALRRTGI
ncbi:hypothetical protein [Mesorhizobium sp. M2D.F.Ca.ET.223.01.1.1]|uniref:hypothetical protein n=1 Tax=Mesorhizobium sp. M2D.F.Ca.ET.223.01.1.1 TaxID=2563940 RepID=UPI0010929E80|nr:hypothetical protein [Mesorhizobium sp. M2D.F.Ca.ET.223.01.1.1]